MAIATEILDNKYLEQPTRLEYLIPQDASTEQAFQIIQESFSPTSHESAIVFHSLNPSIQECAQKYLQGLDEGRQEFLIREAPYMKFGERASNGLMLALIERSDYGKKIQAKRDSSEHLDHNHSHEGRVERYQEAGVLLSYETPIEYKPAMLAMQLFPENHDAIQLEAFDINDSLSQGELKQDVKMGHGEAGALRIRALTNLYAKENFISDYHANIITGICALQILYHERADQLHKVFQGTINARDFSAEKERLLSFFASNTDEFHEQLTTSLFIKAYKDNQLDPLTLSSQDIALIAIASRLHTDSNKKKMVTEETPFGLHPDFEKEFQEELFQCLSDQTPFLDFSGLSDEEITSRKKSIEIATHQAILADTNDWVMPPDLANARTFTGSKSLVRPFVQGTKKDILESIYHDGVHASDSINSDTRRKLFEFDNMDKQLENSPLKESKYIQGLIYSCQIAAIDSFQLAGNVVMSGDETMIQQYFQQIIDEEKNKIKEKLIKKQESLDHPIFSILDHEVTRIMNALKNTGKIKEYSDQEKGDFNIVCDTVRENVIQRHRQKNIKPLHFQVPFGSYISTSLDYRKKKTNRQHANHRVPMAA